MEQEQKTLMGFENMPESFIVINTKDSAEFKKLLPAIKQLANIGNLLFTRVGKDAQRLTSELVDDIRNHLHFENFGSVLALTSRTLEKELQKRDLRMEMFVGSNPEIINKKPNAVDDLVDVNYRYVSVCKKCECILHEKTQVLPRSKLLKRLQEHKEHPRSREIEYKDQSNISVIVSEDTCERGCN